MPFGISTALLTPFHADGSLNLPLFCSHAKAMLANGVNGVTLFGTTGEGASIGFAERAGAIGDMVASGVAPDRMTVGICATSAADAAAQVEQGLGSGISQFLLLPPFYFNGVSDAGLFAWYSSVIGATGDRARFILYHIPQVTDVPLSVDLVLGLRRAFPARVMAIKDSAGDWNNTLALLETGEIPVLVGDERLLHKAAARGAAGSICGMANLYPRRMRTLFDTHVEDVELSAEVDLVVSVPVMPALKQAMAAMSGDASWTNLRPPLEPLRGSARKAIAERFPQGRAA